MYGKEFCVNVIVSRWMRRIHIRFAKCIIPDWPGWLRCIEFIIGFRSEVGIYNFSSSRMHPDGAVRSSLFREPISTEVF